MADPSAYRLAYGKALHGMVQSLQNSTKAAKGPPIGSWHIKLVCDH